MCIIRIAMLGDRRSAYVVTMTTARDRWTKGMWNKFNLIVKTNIPFDIKHIHRIKYYETKFSSLATCRQEAGILTWNAVKLLGFVNCCDIAITTLKDIRNKCNLVNKTRQRYSYLYNGSFQTSQPGVILRSSLGRLKSRECERNRT